MSNVLRWEQISSNSFKSSKDGFTFTLKNKPSKKQSVLIIKDLKGVQILTKNFSTDFQAILFANNYIKKTG